MPLVFGITNNCFKFIICPTVIVSKTNIVYIQNEIRRVERSVIPICIINNWESIEIFSVCTCDFIIDEFIQITDRMIDCTYSYPQSSPCNDFFIDFRAMLLYPLSYSLSIFFFKRGLIYSNSETESDSSTGTFNALSRSATSIFN